MVGIERCHKERFKGNGHFWEDVRGRLLIEWDEGGACIAVLPSVGFVLW